MFRKTTTVLAGALLALALLATGCAKSEAPVTAEESAPGKAAFPVTVTDDAGREVTIEAEPKRIVSLAPANTEILAGLGLTDRIVGVTTYDDYPAEVKDLPKVGDFTTPNYEAIAGADPDLVLVTLGVQADAIGKLEELGAKVLAIDPQTLEAVYDSIADVAAATGASDEGEDLVARMKEDLAIVRQKVGAEEPVECFVEIAQEPLYTAGPGTLMDDLVKAAGGKNVVAEEGFVAYAVEQLLAADPDVYLATRGSMNDTGAVGKRPGYDKLAAVKAGRVHLLDDNLVSRPGPRVTQGVEQIARGLHPKAFE